MYLIKRRPQGKKAAMVFQSRSVDGTNTSQSSIWSQFWSSELVALFVIDIQQKYSHPSDKRPEIEPWRGDEEEDEDEDGRGGLAHHALTTPSVTWVTEE